MPGRNKLLKQCESYTRGSKFTVRCRCKGNLMKTGHYRCKYHAGMSTGPTTLAGQLKSLKNLPQYKNKTDEYILDAMRKNRKYYREA